jgi:hypothetical protein
VKVRPIDLYVFGPEKLIVCKDCEMAIVKFARQYCHFHMDHLKETRISKKHSEDKTARFLPENQGGA